MKPNVVTSEPELDAVRVGRESLRVSMQNFEDALAMPAVGLIPSWTERVRRTGGHLRAQLDEHIVITEGPEGFHAEIVAAAPRLAHAVEILVREHKKLVELATAMVAAAEDVESSEGAQHVRELGTDLLAHLSRHRQRGADLIYEAYDLELGGGD